ncbi:MAG: NRDE family protein [Cyclonatronaceae bacterium]
MCLLVFAWKVHPDYDLILAANRDEFLNRPARSATFWDDEPELLAGMDLEGGGTWLGVTLDGKFSAITNYRDMKLHKENAPSRGKLPLNYLNGRKPPSTYIESIRSGADSFNGFNLIAGNRNAIWYYSNIRDMPKELGPGIYGLSNHLLDTPWPKVVKAKEALAAIVASHEPNHEKLFRLLHDRTPAPENQLPDTGLDRAAEKKLSSAFIEMDGYGTRASTVIMLKKNGQLEFRERVHQNSDQETPGDSCFRFLIHG